MNIRTQQAKTIKQVAQIDYGKFKVEDYTISATDNGLICDCPDHQTTGADCKHIKAVLDASMKNKGYKNEPFRIMERSKLRLCKYCSSGRIVKNGSRQNKTGTIQMFKCRDCGRKFTDNFGFEKRQYDNITITGALQMYYTGMSVRDIADHYELLGIQVSHMTIYRWVAEYSDMVDSYLEQIVPRTSDRLMVRADEMWIKISGQQKYLFASMDDDTRYWLASDMAHTKFQHNADTLLKSTKERTGCSPAHFVTDGLPAYDKSSRRVFGAKTNHIKHIHIAGKRDRDNNNKMERLNGEIRDREKVFRGLKKFDTAIIPGMKAYYNYTKKHGSLGGRTPAEAAKILVDGTNKWETLIQNASLYQEEL